MLASSVVTYGIYAPLTLPGIHKREIPCQFKTLYLSASSEARVLWSKQQREKWTYIFMHLTLVLFSGVQQVVGKACKLSLFPVSRKKAPTKCATR